MKGIFGAPRPIEVKTIDRTPHYYLHHLIYSEAPDVIANYVDWDEDEEPPTAIINSRLG